MKKILNPELKKVILTLKAASKKEGKVIWSALANELDKSKRSRTAVNLGRINRHTKEGDIIAVPGKVLSSGDLDHQLTIAAYSYSDGAKEKIARSNSYAISLLDLIAEDIEPSKIKILK